jgi:uncharacterized membrane protein YraQ (UPF0718 family)
VIQLNANLVTAILLRTVQTALAAAPTLLCGLMIAGMVRGMIGPAAVRRLLSRDARIGPVRAWVIGLLLPVCSLGVLPIAWELRRARLRRGTVLTFLLTAPLADPFSLTYAYGKLEGQGAYGLGFFALLLAGSFIVLVGLGIAVNRWLPDDRVIGDGVIDGGPIGDGTIDELPPPASGLTRVGVAVLAAARGLTGPLLLFVLLGAIGSGLLAIVPGGALERAANDRSSAAPLRLALVSIPLQVPPEQGMVYVCEMLFHGSTLGTVFVFFLLGIGCNIATLAWTVWKFGWRIALVAAVWIIGAALVLGYALPVSLPKATSDSGPIRFLEIESAGNPRTVRTRFLRTTVSDATGQTQWFMVGTWAALGGLATIGVVSRALGERGRISRWSAPATVTAGSPISPTWNKPLGAGQRIAAGAIAALAAIVLGLYLYYPNAGELLNDMDGVQLELAVALKSEPFARDDAIRLAARWKRLQNKLSMAELLRHGRFDARLRTSNEQLRQKIDQLRAALVEGEPPEELVPLAGEARRATISCREAIDRRPLP